MKRVSALICLMIMAVSILAPSCFEAKETANTQKGEKPLRKTMRRMFPWKT